MNIENIFSASKDHGSGIATLDEGSKSSSYFKLELDHFTEESLQLDMWRLCFQSRLDDPSLQIRGREKPILPDTCSVMQKKT